MVHIIDGEIIQDDDPRVLRMRKSAAQSSSSSTQSATLRNYRPRPQGPMGAQPQRSMSPIENQLGLPPQLLAPVFDVGGVSVAPIHLILVGVASLMFGWKGGLCAGVLVYFYLQNLEASGSRPSGSGSAPGTAAGPAPGRTGMGLGDYFQRDPRSTASSSTTPSQRPSSQPRGRRLNEE